MVGWAEKDFESFWTHYKLCQEWIGIARNARQTAINDLEWKQAENDVYSMLSIMRPSANTTKVITADPESSKAVEQSNVNENDEDNEENDSGDEEMSEEMIAFFKQTLEHREAREKRRKLEKGEEEESREGFSWLNTDPKEDYVMADEVGIYGVRRQTTEGPTDAQKLTEARKTEMSARYGKASEKLMAMEMTMNFKFSQHQNKCQPELWPNIPLRF